MIDITRQKKLQNLSDQQRQRLSSIIDGTHLGTWEWNIQTGETVFNERWAEIIGYTLDEIEPVNIETFTENLHPDDLENSEKKLNDHFSGKNDYYDFECRMKHKNGQWIWVHDRGKVVSRDKEGKPLMMYGTHADITEKKLFENKIKELSIRDPLTNIYNRRYIFERLEIDLLRYKRDENPFSIVIMDIDYFKNINDTFGHLAGDFILKEFTKIIADNLRIHDLLGRYGGEEFLVVVYNNGKKSAASLIERLLQIIREKIFIFENNKIQFTFSAGIADTNDDDLSIKKLVDIADKRLYAAKESGRNKLVKSDED